AVHAERVERVVILEDLLELAAEVAHTTADHPEDDAGGRSDVTGARGDDDQAGNHAAGEAEDRRLAVLGPFEKHPRETGGDSPELGVGERESRDAAGDGQEVLADADRRASVKAEPAEPEHAGADEGQTERVRGHRDAAVALTRSDDQRNR